MDGLLKDPKKSGALLRLADVGLVAASVVHEMRQPLVGIKAFAQLIESEPENAKALASDIVEQAIVLETMLNRLRAYIGVGPEDSRPKRAEISASVDSAAAILAGVMRKSQVTLECSITPSLPPAAIPQAALLQIVVNLLRNAVEAKPRAVVHLSAATDREKIVVEVRDEGPGVAASFRERLFRPLETTKPDGMGLGLYASRAVAESAGGTLELSPGSEAGGARFILRVPIA